jgi:hypothetical protein
LLHARQLFCLHPVVHRTPRWKHLVEVTQTISLLITTRKRYAWFRIVHPDHLLLDSVPNLGPLISRWERDKFKNC